MRLIDADKIDFGKIFVGNADLAKAIRDTAQEYIDAQPTAYDVDKVRAQLKERLCSAEDEASDIECHARNRHFRDAIEIVRAGIKV